jgi:hypothetical protein
MSDDGKKLIDSAILLWFARFAMPIIIAIVGALGTIVLHDVQSSIDEVKQSTHAVYSRIDALSSAAAQGATDIKVLSNDLTNSDKIVADHETRLRVIESVRPKP